MPKAYRDLHVEAEIREHARAVLARDRRPAHVELLTPTLDAPGTLCVVADDRPGLLATISAALVLSSLDVIDAVAYTRKDAAGRAEAVDIFWVRHSDMARRTTVVTEAEAREVEKNLLLLLGGDLDIEVASRRPPPVREKAEKPQKPAQTTVRFVENAEGDLATLEVETDDRSGLLLALAQALYAQKVQIVESQVHTKDQHVLDRFRIVELDGKPIGAARRLDIQVAVLSALGPS